MILPWSFDLVVFCIIVIAGLVNVEDSTVFIVIAAMEIQKLPLTIQAKAVKGKAVMELKMQM